MSRQHLSRDSAGRFLSPTRFAQPPHGT
jgi:hypothetical protein